MAAIGQIRKHSGLLIAIVGIALAAFVLGDFLKPSSSRPRQYVGVIDGEQISTIEFNNKVNERLEATKNQRQTDRLTPQDNFQIRQAVWNEMVEQILLKQELEELGLTVTADELSEQILGDKPHQFVSQSFSNPNTGQFDPEMLRNFLANLDNQDREMRQRYLTLENMVKQDRKKKKFTNLMTKGYFVPEAFAKLDYNNKNLSADIRFVGAKLTAVNDSLAKVSDSELRTYYNEHQYEYEQEETRSMDYVVFEVQPSSDDRKEIANTVNTFYKEFKNVEDVAVFVNSVSDSKYDSTYKKEAELPARIAKDMFTEPVGTMVGPYVENETYHIAKLIDRQARPDSIEMSQILISYATAPAGAGINDRTLEQAQNLKDSLLTVLEKDPSKFEDIAIKFSDYPSAAEDKGSIGWVIDGEPGFATFYKKGWETKEGKIAEMETTLGLHIVKVSDKTEPIEKAKVAMVTRAIEPSSETFQKKYIEASMFSSVNNTLAKFDTAVVGQGLNKRSADNLNEMSNRMAGIDNSRQVIRWAFFDNTDLNDVSSVFQDEKKYIVAALKSVIPKGVTPLEDVKEQIRPLVMNQKKADILQKRINDFDTNDLYQIAAKLNEKVDTTTLSFNARNIPGFGSEYEVIGKVFTLETGVSSGPLKGNNGVFIIIADAIKTPEAQASYASSTSSMERKFSSQFMGSAFVNALKEKADIEDNRLMIY